MRLILIALALGCGLASAKTFATAKAIRDLAELAMPARAVLRTMVPAGPHTAVRAGPAMRVLADLATTGQAVQRMRQRAVLATEDLAVLPMTVREAQRMQALEARVMTAQEDLAIRDREVMAPVAPQCADSERRDSPALFCLTLGGTVASPDILYRYQKFDSLELLEDLLVKNRMYFPSPSQLNDPFECAPRWIYSRNGEVSLEDALVTVRVNRGHLPKQEQLEFAMQIVAGSKNPALVAMKKELLTQRLKDILGGTSLKCFSETPTNLQQWAYYGDAHQGMCVGFSFPEPVIYLGADGRPTKAELANVEYKDAYPEVDADGDFRNSGWLRVAVFTKHQGWSHEREWRMARHIPNGWQDLPPKCVRQVIVGFRMVSEQRDRLVAFVRQSAPHVDIFTTKPREYEFSLDVVPI